MTQFAGFPVDLHVRGTGPQACATADTFVLVAVNTQQIKQAVLCKPQRNRHSFKQKNSSAEGTRLESPLLFFVLSFSPCLRPLSP